MKNILKNPLFIINALLIAFVGALILNANADRLHLPIGIKNALAAVALMTGSGTQNKLTAFAQTANQIGDSSISDDGVSVRFRENLNLDPGKDINVGGNVSISGTLALVTGNMNFSNGAITTGTTDLTLGATSPRQVRVLGDMNVGGTMTATIKNFVIDYPGRPGYELVHSSLEGPEVPVFYRGTARLINGTAKVTLPDYFDALTRDHSATVLLTARGDIPFLLSYDNFDEKSFVVHGTLPDRAFDWEVKATRQDVPALKVEQLKK